MKLRKSLSSIRVKMFLMYAGSLVLLVVIFMLLNKFFLSTYYVKDLEKSLIKHYDKIKVIEDEEELSEYLLRLIRSEGIQSMVIDEDYLIVFETMAANMSLTGKLGTGNSTRNGQGNMSDGMMIPPGPNSTPQSGTMQGGVNNLPNNDIESNSKESEESEGELDLENRVIPVHIRHMAENITNSENNYVYEVATTEFNEKDVVLIGDLDEGMQIVMYTSVEILDQYAEIANTFFIYGGIFVIVLGSIFVFFFSKQITVPIIRLNNITKKLSNQDFSEKFIGSTEDEIGQLGHNVNLMSEKLSSAMNTIMLANESLKDDIQKKEAINRMREEFIANVSHELKTPIGIIKGYVEGLRYEVPGTADERDRYFQVIINESDKMSNMVMELLDLSSLESETTTLMKMVFNISVLLDEIIEKFNPIFIEKEIDLKLEINDDYFVEADYMKIEQVISNYINNALNHVDENKKIEISVSEVDNNIRVTVFNTGKNIDEKLIENIWTSFYKVDKARTRKYGGTGLGLSIVRAIVDKHKGIYGIRNLQNGVAFYFGLKKYEEIYFE